MTTRDREGLEASLRRLGIRCTVESWDALAVALPESGERAFEDAAVRKQAIALARSHGFSHLAVELRDPALPDGDARAALPRD